MGFQSGERWTQEATHTANGTRSQMAQLVKQIKSGEVNATDLLTRRDIPLTLDRLLIAIPRVGRSKAIRVLREASTESQSFITGYHRLAPAHDVTTSAVLTNTMREALIRALNRDGATTTCRGVGCDNYTDGRHTYCSDECRATARRKVAA